MKVSATDEWERSAKETERLRAIAVEYTRQRLSAAEAEVDECHRLLDEMGEPMPRKHERPLGSQ